MCCTFNSLDGQLGKNQFDLFEKGQLGSCEEPLSCGGGVEVSVTSTGTDGWRGEFVEVASSNESTNCKITQWVDDKGTIQLSCGTPNEIGKCILMYEL